jgi:hypothetical protein
MIFKCYNVSFFKSQLLNKSNKYPILQLRGIYIEDNGFKSCWEYYKCSEESMQKCPAFTLGVSCKQFSDCWLFVKDNLVGGCEKHGPCVECEWNHKYGFYKK